MGVDDDLSPYEKLRLENIRRNEEELRRLGLHVNKLTTLSAASSSSSALTRRPRRKKTKVHLEAVRRSSRVCGRPAPSYKEYGEKEFEYNGGDPVRRPAKRAKTQNVKSTKPANPHSIKVLNADVAKMQANWIGTIIPPWGGQVKRAAMEELYSGKGSPRFSRMSGIQEWKNSVALFVNVYGTGYKNVFLNGGNEITWFAQSRQTEHTPVIKRLVRSEGGVYIDENDEGEEEEVDVKPTPVLLFCRNLGQGYVYCGRCLYLGHDPSRSPIRFVWQLQDFDKLKQCEPFNALIDACGSLVPGR